MKVVLAALDSGAAARPVIETAIGFAELTGAEVRAVHVGTDRTELPEWLAARNGVALTILIGPIEQALLDALEAPDVIAAVVGARSTPAGRRPAGRTAVRLLEKASKPILIVPPEAPGLASRPFTRLLIPLEGSHVSSRPVTDKLCPLLSADVELRVLHVFTSDTTPKLLDRPGRDLEMLGAEFLARQLPNASGIEMRGGQVGAAVVEACQRDHIDLVVLSWAQDGSAGRAAVIRDVLGRSVVPVLLLPVEEPAREDDRAPVSSAVERGSPWTNGPSDA